MQEIILRIAAILIFGILSLTAISAAIFILKEAWDWVTVVLGLLLFAPGILSLAVSICLFF